MPRVLICETCNARLTLSDQQTSGSKVVCPTCRKLLYVANAIVVEAVPTEPASPAPSAGNQRSGWPEERNPTPDVPDAPSPRRRRLPRPQRARERSSVGIWLLVGGAGLLLFVSAGVLIGVLIWFKGGTPRPTEAKFASITRDMTERQVQGLLGPPSEATTFENPGLIGMMGLRTEDFRRPTGEYMRIRSCVWHSRTATLTVYFGDGKVVTTELEHKNAGGQNSGGDG